MRVRASVDRQRRAGAMRHHTGTHLLHAALREALGPHVKQAGSLVEPERLRFDFSHYAPLTSRELRALENRVNCEVLKTTTLETKLMGREEALAYGALAFFGDKYGERVRVVEVPGFSKEFCGGTHVHDTGEVGLFLFTGEQGIAAGTRRVEALTGEAALQRAQQDQAILEELEQTAKADRAQLVDEYARLREQLKAKERELQALKLKLATGAVGSSGDLEDWNGVLLWTPIHRDLDKKMHADVVADFSNRNLGRDFLVVSVSVSADGVRVICAVSRTLESRVKATDMLVRLSLKGGGKPSFAQGGGPAVEEVEAFRKKASELMKELLAGVSA
jgi:alanyl-tRNA synthetase